MRPDPWPSEKGNLSWGSRLKTLGMASEAILPISVNCPVEVSTVKQELQIVNTGPRAGWVVLLYHP